MNILLKLFLAVAPLLFTVILTWLTMEGLLNFGSGEKDIFLAIPLLLWSLVYLCSYLCFWYRRASTSRTIAMSSVIATVVVVVVWAVLFGVVLALMR